VDLTSLRRKSILENGEKLSRFFLYDSDAVSVSVIWLFLICFA